MLIHVMESSSVLLSRRSKCFKHFVCTIDRTKCSLVVSDAGKNLDIGPLDISKDSVKSRWKEITGYFFFLFLVIQPCVEMGDSAR